MEKLYKLEKHKVLIIGDIMLDRYLDGNVSRVSPEAPVPVLEKVKMENKPGGAANVALNIKSLGSEPYLLSIIGNDENGKDLLNCLEESDISTSYIFEDKNRTTTVKTRIMSGGQHLLRIDEEVTSNINSENEEKLKDTFLSVLSKEQIDAIIFQDYDKGLLSDKLIQYLINKANERNIFISVDPKFNNFFSYKNVDLFKPNLKEVGAAINKSIEPIKENLDSVAEKINAKLNFKNLFITLGHKGIYHNNGKVSTIIATKLRDVVDVSGAGDVVLSIATLSFLDEMNPIDVAYISNIAGGLACSKVGVATVGKKRLLEEVKKTFK